MSNSDNNSVNIKSGNDSTTIEKRFTGGDGQGNLSLILPDKNFKYNPDNTAYSDKDIYLVASKNEPSSSLSETEFTDAFLKYTNDGSITWVPNSRQIEDFESNFRGQVNLLSSELLVGNKDGTPSNRSKVLGYLVNKKVEWISLHSSISDIGLNQIAWNTNENYVIMAIDNNSNFQTSKNLRIKHNESNPDNLTCKVNYINDSGKIDSLEKIMPSDTDSKLDSSINMLKVNSVEITGGVNKNDIEFYFEGEKKENINGGIKEMALYKKGINTCFDYNEDYYQNPNYNSFLNEISDELDDTSNTSNDILIGTIEKDKFNVSNTEENNTFLELLSNLTKYDLEGGMGRKSIIQSDISKQLTIYNPGYLYQVDDELRFKNQGKLRDNYFFKVSDISSSDTNDSINNPATKYLQEFIKAGNGKSNTLKYAVGNNEIFVIKNLNVGGSTQSNIVVKLVKISNTYSSELSKLTVTKQQVLKEMYYYNRNNINENHDLNIHIEANSEIYINIQKIIKNTDTQIDKNDMSTLNFSLNGIKYTTS